MCSVSERRTGRGALAARGRVRERACGCGGWAGLAGAVRAHARGAGAVPCRLFVQASPCFQRLCTIRSRQLYTFSQVRLDFEATNLRRFGSNFRAAPHVATAFPVPSEEQQPSPDILVESFEAGAPPPHPCPYRTLHRRPYASRSPLSTVAENRRGNRRTLGRSVLRGGGGGVGAQGPARSAGPPAERGAGGPHSRGARGVSD